MTKELFDVKEFLLLSRILFRILFIFLRQSFLTPRIYMGGR